MSIFTEVKEHLTARQAAEYYGLKVRRNGLACCPFHDDRHPSMKIDRNYHCFACGVGGDVIDYVARLCGLTQYEAACKLIEDFALPVPVKSETELSAEEKERIRRARQERERIIHIRERFGEWCEACIDRIKVLASDCWRRLTRLTASCLGSRRMKFLQRITRGL